jgi:hypothetical protein
MSALSLFFLAVFAYLVGSTLAITALIMRWVDAEQLDEDKELAARLLRGVTTRLSNLLACDALRLLTAGRHWMSSIATHGISKTRAW